MDLAEKLLHFQNTAEENFNKSKSLKNIILYFIALIIFFGSTIFAALSFPFRSILKLTNGKSQEPNIINIDHRNFELEINEHKILMLDFWAEWCGPCIMMNPILEEFAEANKNITIGKINADLNRGLMKDFQIRGIPQFVLFRNGKEVKRHAGPLTRADLTNFAK